MVSSGGTGNRVVEVALEARLSFFYLSRPAVTDFTTRDSYLTMSTASAYFFPELRGRTTLWQRLPPLPRGAVNEFGVVDPGSRNQYLKSRLQKRVDGTDASEQVENLPIAESAVSGSQKALVTEHGIVAVAEGDYRDRGGEKVTSPNGVIFEVNEETGRNLDNLDFQARQSYADTVVVQARNEQARLELNAEEAHLRAQDNEIRQDKEGVEIRARPALIEGTTSSVTDAGRPAVRIAEPFFELGGKDDPNRYRLFAGSRGIDLYRFNEDTQTWVLVREGTGTDAESSIYQAVYLRSNDTTARFYPVALSDGTPALRFQWYDSAASVWKPLSFFLAEDDSLLVSGSTLPDDAQMTGQGTEFAPYNTLIMQDNGLRMRMAVALLSENPLYPVMRSQYWDEKANTWKPAAMATF